MQIFDVIIQFEWDDGNSGKNLEQHSVTNGECEETFFDPNKMLLKDVLHSRKEKRYILLGMTVVSRLLFIVFTIRKGRIRIISARDLNKKERQLYEKN